MSLRLIWNQNNVVLSFHNALVVGEYFVLQNSHHDSNQVLGGGATWTSMLMAGNFILKSLLTALEPKCPTPKALPYTLCFE